MVIFDKADNIEKMALLDRDIKATTGLITPLKNENVFSCGYNLSIGSVFKPGTGKEQQIGNGIKIPPNGTAIIMTKEKVKLPNDIYATYNPPYDLARQGILMLNACVVEPAYEGYLSCFFVNLSSVDFCLNPTQVIAKIMFYKLDSVPENVRSETIEMQNYKSKLFQQANKFHTSFLDIKGIEERTTKASEKSIRSSIRFGGIVVAVLLIYSTIQPMISQYIWDSSPVYDKRMDELQKKIMDNLELTKDIESKQKELDSLTKIKIKELKSK